MTANKAAKTLETLRDRLAKGESCQQILKECDQVGAWLATQQYSKKVQGLLREAHDLAQKCGA